MASVVGLRIQKLDQLLCILLCDQPLHWRSTTNWYSRVQPNSINLWKTTLGICLLTDAGVLRKILSSKKQKRCFLVSNNIDAPILPACKQRGLFSHCNQFFTLVVPCGPTKNYPVEWLKAIFRWYCTSVLQYLWSTTSAGCR